MTAPLIVPPPIPSQPLAPQGRQTDPFVEASQAFRAFFQELEGAFFERETLLVQTALGLLCREHVLVTGPPGTAKSAVANSVLGRIVDERTGLPSLFSKQLSETTVQADLIDIQDSVRFGASLAIPLNPPADSAQVPTLSVDQPGFDAVNLVSTGDIRFLVNARQAATPQTNLSIVTSLASPGDITFTAAQIYPVTGAEAIVLAGFNPSYSGSGSGYYAAGAITINGIAGDDPRSRLRRMGA